MANIARLDPFNDMDDLFKGLFVRPLRVGFDVPEQMSMKIDVTRSNGSYSVKAEMPGVSKEDINVSIDGNVVTISGEVAPGVYGRVDIGNRPRPPLVFEQPVVVVRQGRAPGPIYMHVPPGHARNWSKHCAKYNACRHPVYFVKSAEYEPGYRHPGAKGAAKAAGKGRGKGRD